MTSSRLEQRKRKRQRTHLPPLPGPRANAKRKKPKDKILPSSESSCQFGKEVKRGRGRVARILTWGIRFGHAGLRDVDFAAWVARGVRSSAVQSMVSCRKGRILKMERSTICWTGVSFLFFFFLFSVVFTKNGGFWVLGFLSFCCHDYFGPFAQAERTCCMPRKLTVVDDKVGRGLILLVTIRSIIAA